MDDMRLCELIETIHQNAVDHGWWEEDRSPGHVIALIHSEWSEALEEARNGNPMVYKVALTGMNARKVKPGDVEYGVFGKPEGVAVEIADGAIRILDYMGHLGFKPTQTVRELMKETCRVRDNVPDMIAELHKHTSYSYVTRSGKSDDVSPVLLHLVLTIALKWIETQGIDPLALILEKHEYNKTRPYKHGKRF